MSANRRKLKETRITVASTDTSGTTGETANAASHDRVTYFVNITTATAGSIVLVIQSSPDDGTTWFDLATAEMSGNTGSLTTTGAYHVSSTGPLGLRTRLKYTITTGPFAFTVDTILEKTGRVHG